jgi:nitrate reductase cytochrome c-type subunit
LQLKKSDWIFVLVVGAVIGALAVLSVVRKQPPLISLAVAEHVGMTTDTGRDACLACHAPDSSGKLVIDPKTHPTKWKDEKMSCTKCHAVEGARTASIPTRDREERLLQ